MTAIRDRIPSIDQVPVRLNVQNVVLKVAAEHFDQLCLDNPDLRLELTKDGELRVMPLTEGETGQRNAYLVMEVGIWNRQAGMGEVFDSSTGYDFTALGGGKVSPDVSWIEKSRLAGINLVGFIPVVPDFVIELRSVTNALKAIQIKMQDYRRLGVRLGLLINPQDQQVEVYCPGEETLVLASPSEIDCGAVMPGFVLDLRKVLSER